MSHKVSGRLVKTFFILPHGHILYSQIYQQLLYSERIKGYQVIYSLARITFCQSNTLGKFSDTVKTRSSQTRACTTNKRRFCGLSIIVLDFRGVCSLSAHSLSRSLARYDFPNDPGKPEIVRGERKLRCPRKCVQRESIISSWYIYNI